MASNLAKQKDPSAVVRRWVGGARDWVTGFLGAASSDSSLIAIVAMGSSIRPRGHRRSDFDLLVIYQRTRPAIKPPLEVDVRFVSTERIEMDIATGNDILGWAIKFGMALHDPQGYWDRLQDAWRERLPLPSADEARRRADQSLARAVEMLKIGDDSAADDLLLAALTQFARERLISAGVFPASRPELPDQLRQIREDDPLARLLHDAMFEHVPPTMLLRSLKRSLHAADRATKEGKGCRASNLG